jgi:hypothetical protein
LDDNGYCKRACFFAGITAIDWGQTLNIADHPEKWSETNPIFGKHPSRGKVNTYFASVLVLHPLVSAVLQKKYREIWQWVSIGVSSYYVGHNYHVGISAKW